MDGTEYHIVILLSAIQDESLGGNIDNVSGTKTNFAPEMAATNTSNILKSKCSGAWLEKTSEEEKPNC
jgi:hypothetical protein